MSKNLFQLIKTDLVAAMDKDPAARNHFEEVGLGSDFVKRFIR